jgi:hypothetical protein
MGFFDDLEGMEKAKLGEFAGTEIELIPKGTQLLAYIEDASIETFNGEKFIELKWRVNKPAEYANRMIFQKLRIWDADQKKRNRAMLMLAAIDANSGGVIASQAREPDDALLSRALLNKPMIVKVEIWDIDGKSGNWICAIAAKPKGEVVAPQAPTNTTPSSEIPF